MLITILKLVFWSALALLVYTFVGYGIILYIMVRIKRIFKGKPELITDIPDDRLPEVTFIVPAYNEEDWIEDKIDNTVAFEYPKDKIRFFFVTDGCSDRTPEIIRDSPVLKNYNFRLFHEDSRKGKITAVERIMKYVETPITIYTDANTVVNKMAIKNIVRHYFNPKVGAVAGEKRIFVNKKAAANSAGEGFYWKYESNLKRLDSELFSVVGAAGELFSIRTKLFEAVPSDTIIEDFYMTLRIAEKGYKVAYEPMAYAEETSSASVKEELKRKIRIAAGGLQAVSRLTPLLNPFKYGLLTFQYVSHRVLRWTLAPIALPISLITNVLLVVLTNSPLFTYLLIAQVLFYFAASVGYLLEKKELKIKAFFVPYYFCIMNYAVYRGFFRFIGGKQSVIWEKAKRA